jgi:thiamine-monophosphate kinase
MRGEFDFIASVRRRVRALPGRRTAGLVAGIGDDGAIMRPRAGHDLIITADLLVEEIDFRLEWTAPRLLGHKALAVSLSDIAAMGARPRWALLSLGIPDRVWKGRFLDEFYDGFLALAADHEVTLIGGDLSRAPARLVIDSIVVGEVARGRAARRAGARPGDLIYVTGTLGGAAAGLRLLESGARLTRGWGARTRTAARDGLLLRQLRPMPRLAWGRLLGEKKLATAMIDLSDGLSSDLAHLCRESAVGAVIDARRIPVNAAIERQRRPDWDPQALALHGGEDFELLFTVRPRRAAQVPQEIDGVPATCIGRISDTAGRIMLVSDGKARRLAAQGFTHF